MTQLLERAMIAASKLPTEEQDIVASIVLEEINSELKWDRSFEKSQDLLSSLANEALSDFEKGRTGPLDFAKE
jgi:hypothetical protein